MLEGNAGPSCADCSIRALYSNGTAAYVAATTDPLPKDIILSSNTVRSNGSITHIYTHNVAICAVASTTVAVVEGLSIVVVVVVVVVVVKQ